jgi:hypothetical protein
MKNATLPYKITEYVKEHFKEDFLFEVKDVRKIKNDWFYTVEVTKDNYIHTLKFNHNGEIMADEAQQAFPSDIHDELGFEDVPD